jgi:hypothetical protein
MTISRMMCTVLLSDYLLTALFSSKLDDRNCVMSSAENTTALLGVVLPFLMKLCVRCRIRGVLYQVDRELGLKTVKSTATSGRNKQLIDEEIVRMRRLLAYLKKDLSSADSSEEVVVRISLSAHLSLMCRKQ